MAKKLISLKIDNELKEAIDYLNACNTIEGDIIGKINVTKLFNQGAKRIIKEIIRDVRSEYTYNKEHISNVNIEEIDKVLVKQKNLNYKKDFAPKFKFDKYERLIYDNEIIL